MFEGLKEIVDCEVCGNQELKGVLDLGSHPMCDDLVEVDSNRVCREYPIEILYCENCYTAHQKYQIPKNELFPVNYHYRSRFTADVLNGMKALVSSCEDSYGSLQGKSVIDIGCNDGSLLDFFREKGAVTIGIEPTGAFQDALDKKHIVYNEYLSESVAADIKKQYGSPDIITFTNVFAHIENLKEVLDSLKCLIGENTTIVIENHYLGSVLSTNQFDTFYHEHPRTYSYRSFVFMAESLGLKIHSVNFPSRYGGNIQIFMGATDLNIDGADLHAVALLEDKFSQQFVELDANIRKWKESKSKEIELLVSLQGKIRAKAFPGRAAILVKILGLDESVIEAVHEKPGSLKIGNYLPGTRIPIVSDDELFTLEKSTVPILNLAWHISSEIKSYLKVNGHKGDVIDILAVEDFE